VSAVPSTFSVGGVQLRVTLEGGAVGGLLLLVDPEPVEAVEVLAPEVLLPEVLLPEVLLPEVPGAELWAVDATPEEFPAPQAESVRPSAAATRKWSERCKPPLRLAFRIFPPELSGPDAGVAGESWELGDCSKPSAVARLLLHEVAFRAARQSHSPRDLPGNPAVVGFAPLDRKFCDVRLSAAVPLRAAECESAARVEDSNGYASGRGCGKMRGFCGESVAAGARERVGFVGAGRQWQRPRLRRIH
jgi:hypothetical protein